MRLKGSAFPLALIIAGFAAIKSPKAFAQGCIASRGTGLMAHSCDGTHFGEEGDVHSGTGFRASVGYRWLHSDRMYIRDVEQTQRETEGSQEINDSHFIDFGLTYTFSPRFSATLTLPYSAHDRSEVVRRRNAARTILGRFHTKSDGIGDIRLEGIMWLLDPKTHSRGNVLLGVGVAGPSGERDVQDGFQEPIDSTRRLETKEHAVDPSIQLGNGGWGIILDFYTYQEIVPRLNAFASASYTMTPEEKYSPSNMRSIYGSDGYSIADNYLCRAGFDFLLWPKYGLSLSLAGRIEGVPVNDLVGDSEGFRRPGLAVSIEPGLGVMLKSWSFSLNTPVALYRNREQSNSEKAASLEPVAAGFADFVVTCSVAKSF